MNYSEKFILIKDTNPDCVGCCFKQDGCNLFAEVGKDFIKEFDSQVGSCVTDGGLYKQVLDTGSDSLIVNFLKSSYN